LVAAQECPQPTLHITQGSAGDAAAVPLRVACDPPIVLEPAMTAPSVGPGTTPDTQSAASDQSPDAPVIQYCVVMAVTSAAPAHRNDGYAARAFRNFDRGC